MNTLMLIRFQNDAWAYPAWPSTGLPATALPPLWGDPTLGLPAAFTYPSQSLDASGYLSTTTPIPTAWGNTTPANDQLYKAYLAKAKSGGALCGPYSTTVSAATLNCITGGATPANASEAYNNNVVGAIATNAALTSIPVPLAPEDQNWKDVIVALPGQVTRVLVRTARPDGTSFTSVPTSVAAQVTANPALANPELLFNPKVGTFPMHCHILEHEENDMMTSFQVQ